MKKKIKEEMKSKHGMRKLLTRKEFWEALILADALYGITRPDLDGSVIIITQHDDSLKELKETEKINPLELKMNISALKVIFYKPELVGSLTQKSNKIAFLHFDK